MTRQPTRRAALLILADLVEAATEGSEDLDLAVHLAAFGQRIGDRQTSTPWTRSLDAALSLVPEGWIWSLTNAAAAPCGARAFIHPHPMPSELPSFETVGATPALALTAAALKARAAMEEE